MSLVREELQLATLRRIDYQNWHKYLQDDERAPGATTLIGDGLRKKALEAWGIRTVAEHVADHLDEVAAMRSMGRDAIVAALKQAPYAQRDAAKERGTEVHALAERLIRGEEVEAPHTIAGHVQSYVRFLDEWKPTPVLVEALVGSRGHWYAGTLDMVVDLPDGRRAIADIKTSRSGIFPETALQLAAYRYAEYYVDDDGYERPMADLGIGCALGIWVTGEGYEVYEIAAGPEQFEAFLHVAQSAAWLKASKGLIGAALPAPAVAS